MEKLFIFYLLKIFHTQNNYENKFRRLVIMIEKNSVANIFECLSDSILRFPSFLNLVQEIDWKILFL